MKNNWQRAITLLSLITVPAWSDTITVKNNSSVNGSVIKMSGGIITLDASFTSELKSLPIPITAVRTIEFNGIRFNPGAPSSVMGIAPPNKEAADAQQTPKENEPTTGNVIIFRGGQQRVCQLLSIDVDRVHCLGKGNDYSRTIVLRIVVDAK